jgi:hypothetical protein
MGVQTPLMGLRGLGEGGPGTAMGRETFAYGPGYAAGGMRGFGAYIR